MLQTSGRQGQRGGVGEGLSLAETLEEVAVGGCERCVAARLGANQRRPLDGGKQAWALAFRASPWASQRCHKPFEAGKSLSGAKSTTVEVGVVGWNG